MGFRVRRGIGVAVGRHPRGISAPSVQIRALQLRGVGGHGRAYWASTHNVPGKSQTHMPCRRAMTILQRAHVVWERELRERGAACTKEHLCQTRCRTQCNKQAHANGHTHVSPFHKVFSHLRVHIWACYLRMRIMRVRVYACAWTCDGPVFTRGLSAWRVNHVFACTSANGSGFGWRSHSASN